MMNTPHIWRHRHYLHQKRTSFSLQSNRRQNGLIWATFIHRIHGIEYKHKSAIFLWWKYQIHHSKYQMIHFILHPVTRIRNSSYMSKESKSLKPLMKSIQLRPWVLKLGGSFRNIQSLFLEAKIFKYAFLGSLWVDSSSEWEGLLWSNMDGPDVFRTVRRICKHEIEKVFEKRVSK